MNLLITGCCGHIGSYVAENIHKIKKIKKTILVDNIKSNDYTVEPNQRLFQLVAMNGSPISFEIVQDLSESTRGEGGFGSTGK